MTATDLNDLEREVVKSEDAASDLRWKQAEVIVARLENETEREVAASWKNVRTGKPYTQQTVSQFAAAHRAFHKVPSTDRPAFWSAVEKAQGTTTRTQRNEAQAPTTPANARKLVANIVTKSPPEVQRAIADELVKQPNTEPSLRRVAEGPKQHKRQEKSPERKLGEATFALWEVGELLLDAVPDGEARVRMTALAEKSERLAAGILHLLGTGELEAEFADLVREVGAES